MGKKIVVAATILILLGVILSGCTREKTVNIQPNTTITNESVEEGFGESVAQIQEIIQEIKDKKIAGTVNEGNVFVDVVSKKNGCAIKADTANTVITGLDIRNSGPGLYTTGIKIIAENVTIENCNIFDTPIGIAIWSSNNLIINCTFWNCEDEGIVLLGNIHRGGDNNTIVSCVFYNCCDGVELQHSSNNTFINCRFINNTHAGVDGIASSNNNNSFTSCVFLDNPFGIYFHGSKNNEYINCTFKNNEQDILEII